MPKRLSTAACTSLLGASCVNPKLCEAGHHLVGTFGRSFTCSSDALLGLPLFPIPPCERCMAT
eukprot:350371-Chlamydomonas_euryale.AAC.4